MRRGISNSTHHVTPRRVLCLGFTDGALAEYVDLEVIVLVWAVVETNGGELHLFRDAKMEAPDAS